MRALAAAAGLDLSFSWGLLFNKRCGILSEDVRARKTRQFRVSIERLPKNGASGLRALEFGLSQALCRAEAHSQHELLVTLQNV